MAPSKKATNGTAATKTAATAHVDEPKQKASKPDPQQPVKTSASGLNTDEAPDVYEYKFYDEKWLFDYHGTKVCYPFYLTLPEVETYQADPSDLAISTFPKCGTTFMRAIAHMVNNNADPKCMTEGPLLDDQFFLMEFCTPNMPVGARPIDLMKATKPPRNFYTHLGYDALPKSITEKAKIIFVIRNPKDTIVSMHNFIRSTPSMGFNGTLEDTFDTFEKNTCAYAPYYDRIADCLVKSRQHKNIFLATYENMVKDFKTVTRDLGTFLGKDLTDQQLNTIAHYCNFDNMKANRQANRSQIADTGYFDYSISPFLRAGKVGNWKENFSPELNKRVDKWIAKEERRLKDQLGDFKFEYE